MKTSLSIYLWGCLLAMLVVLLGLVLVRFGLVTSKNSKRTTLLASLLAAGGCLWLMADSSFVQKQSFLDVLALYAVLIVACFALFWLGVVAGLRRFGHRHGQDFSESSILSMQYLDSDMNLVQAEHDWDFDATQVLSTDVPNSSEPKPTLSDRTAGRNPV